MRVLCRLYSTTRTATITHSTRTPADMLLNRPLPIIRDWISPQPTHLLSLSLQPYLKTQVSRSSPPTSGEISLGHYLVYFPPQLPEQHLLFDGSDAEQSPGQPWSRRMWAGGSVDFSSKHKLNIFDRAALAERVEKVELKGHQRAEDEKLFVWFERRMWSSAGSVGELVMTPGDEAVVERRCLVFMKDRKAAAPMPRLVKPPYEPDFKLTFTPTQHLLFRFSALTFNAHKIHFDSMFSRETEGYPGNLCHGPMSQVLLLELLRKEVLQDVPGKRVKRFDYRCLAPMYVDQLYTIAGRRIAENHIELWAETPQGGYSVRAMAELADV